MPGDDKSNSLFCDRKDRFLHIFIIPFVLLSAIVFGLAESTGSDGSNVQSVHAEGFRGQGVSIGLISQAHTRVSHEAFYEKDGGGNPTGSSHAHWFDATDLNAYEPYWHDTFVGGIVCSRGGAVYPSQKGAAPESDLWSYRVTRPISADDPNRVFDYDWIEDALEAGLAHGCRVIMTGIQFNGTADGESFLSLMYDYYAYEHGLFFATASGNDFSQVTVFGDAYNSLTTGGLIIDGGVSYNRIGTISNPGPTADGRHKPEVCAPSPYQKAPTSSSDTAWTDVTGSTQGFTSYAVPHTAGAAAVLLSYADSTAEMNDSRSEVIKAVLVNAAFPNILDGAGNGTVDPFGPSMPWNAERGYGRLDVYRAFETLSSLRISPGVSTAQQKGWAYQTLGGGQSHSYFVQCGRHERLVITVTWNRRVVWTDPRGPGNGIMEAGELEGYTANIDLQVYDPEGLAAAGVPSPYNSKDNLEKVDLLLTKTGNYEVRVVNQTAGETAAYGLAFEVLERLAGDVHLDYVVDLADLGDMTDWWLYSDCGNPSQTCFYYNLSSNPTIDLSDLAVLATNWLAYDNRYYWP